MQMLKEMPLEQHSFTALYQDKKDEGDVSNCLYINEDGVLLKDAGDGMAQVDIEADMKFYREQCDGYLFICGD